MLQNKKPGPEWLFFDNTEVIRNSSDDVNLPIVPNDEIIMKKLIDFVILSQDDVENADEKIRPAVGLAAPQIGYNKNMYYIRFKDQKNNIEEYAMINPKITGKSQQKAYILNGEGCLSVAQDYEGIVPRSYKIQVEGYDYLKKQNLSLTLRGYKAIVFQHEQDHLIGKLYYDYINKKEPMEIDSDWMQV
ncbi:peptide deformylase [Spiroplasma endosymbiont of Amphibalanus improvisus]|uniref:peptide deformylase n=1 Tax=Spiroplasma endosymbiont of Amphibalanus improvisus TaxID=3066327 RepID=UPI00313CFAEF